MHESHLKTNNKTKTMGYSVFFNVFKSINVVVISSATRFASTAPNFNFTRCRVIVTTFVQCISGTSHIGKTCQRPGQNTTSR